MKIRGAARVQGLLRDHEDNARLARQLTGVAIDPDLQVDAGDVRRRSVSAADVTAVCDELGLGRLTQARLARVVG